VDGHFVESYYPTIENTFSKNIKYKGQEYTTEIIDTAGQVRETFQLPHLTTSHAITMTDTFSHRMNTAF
jgi:GTPase SAR1 family protein